MSREKNVDIAPEVLEIYLVFIFFSEASNRFK